MKCRNCGTEQGRGKFCQKCGQPLITGQQGNTAVRRVRQATPRQISPSEKRVPQSSRQREQKEQRQQREHYQPREPHREQAPSVKKSIILPAILAAAVFVVLILAVFIMFKVNMNKLRQNEGLTGVSASSSEGEPAITPLTDSSSADSTEAELSSSAETPLDDSSAAETGKSKDGKKKDKDKDKKTDSSSSEADKPAEKVNDYGWVDAYINAAEIFDKKRENLPSDVVSHFELCYLDEDDIPELIMSMSVSGEGAAYTYSNGTAICFWNWGGTRAGSINKLDQGTGIFGTYNSGGYNYWSYDTYKLGKNGAVSKTGSFGQDGDNYFIDDSSATEEQVNKKREEYKNNNPSEGGEKVEGLKAFKKLAHSYDPNYSEPEREVRIISAVEIMNMTKGELLDIIGDDYRVSMREFGEGGMMGVQGITSDDYFPNVLIAMTIQESDEQKVLDTFSSIGSNEYFDKVIIGMGGQIQYNARCGDTYEQLMTEIDALNGLNRHYMGDYRSSSSIIGGYSAEIYFDGDGQPLLTNTFGLEVYDLGGDEASRRSTSVELVRDNTLFDGAKATLTEDGAALRAAAHNHSAILLYMEKGAVVTTKGNTITDRERNTWTKVIYTTSDGIVKCGYVRIDQIRYN